MPSLAARSCSITEEDGGLIVLVGRDLPVYARGAALAATLAFPPQRPGDRRTHDAYLAFCRIVLGAGERLDADWQRQPQVLIPEHLAFPSSRAERLEPLLRRQIDERLGAAHAAAPSLIQAEARVRGVDAPRQVPQFQASVIRTIHQEANRVETLAKHGVTVAGRFETNVDNFETRTLRKHLPVIHLAFALAQAIERSQQILAGQPKDVYAGYKADVGEASGDIKPQFGIGELLTVEPMQRFIVERAEVIEGLLPHMAVLAPKRIVRFRLG